MGLGGKLTMFYVFFDLLFYFFCLLYGFCVERGGWRLQERGLGGVLAGREKQRKQSFLIARCPSYTAHTTSTRPVSDNLYC